ncbi:MAG: acetyl-CoA hydrolase, partial [Gammaproteobacteria bacterium]|nr:acetyl-CoA hydrolase [Gammaproteobacteria bacterium]
IFTGLTLEPPHGQSELEKRLLEPLVERLYTDWPVPRYADAIRTGSLPANVRVREFYLRPGGYLGNPYVQQEYSSINYSEVAGELMRLGVNVLAQLVAVSPDRPGRYSLGSNPEVTLDLMPYFQERQKAGLPALLVGQVNHHMPFMPGDADLDATDIDIVLDDSRYDYPLFTLPNRAVSDGDYATAMHVASLVRDGGTLQLGIGSLSDAVAHCLKLRHSSPELFAEILEHLPGGTATERRRHLPVELTPFREGLYASTELLSDALFTLFDAGLIKRPADHSTATVMHAGFFIGSTALYDGLRALPEERRRLIDMTSISKVNTLFGEESEKRAQRRDARFINETMMVTLLGAAVSDALEDGRVVSGVGGQFDFVSMAQSLDGAMSILMCRARRESGGKVSSNIRWNYGHNTVPRHHRDVFVTEYGIAATRGCSDRDTIDRLLHVAGAEFHDSLIDPPRRSGKIERDYRMADDADRNRPDVIASVFSQHREHFPLYPLGTELTSDEQALAEALGWLKTNTATTGSRVRTMLHAVLNRTQSGNEKVLARMGLEDPGGVKQRLMRRLLRYALHKMAQ